MATRGLGWGGRSKFAEGKRVGGAGCGRVPKVGGSSSDLAWRHIKAGLGHGANELEGGDVAGAVEVERLEEGEHLRSQRARGEIAGSSWEITWGGHVGSSWGDRGEIAGRSID